MHSLWNLYVWLDLLFTFPSDTLNTLMSVKLSIWFQVSLEKVKGFFFLSVD